MICLTGDVHHSGFRYREFANPGLTEVPPARRPYLAESEAALARAYVDIARESGLKVTLFLTGLACVRDGAALRDVARAADLEIGAHTHRAFEPLALHHWFKRTTGSFYGPPWYQRWDIGRALGAIRRAFGSAAVSWRTHAYASDAVTWRTLAAHGIRVVSDARQPNAAGPDPRGGLVSLPINVLPDHEHLFHAERTPSALAADGGGSTTPFGRESYPAARWLERVKRDVDRIEACGGVATLLVHPVCMAALDGFATFRALCRFLAGRASIRCRDAGADVQHVDR